MNTVPGHIAGMNGTEPCNLHKGRHERGQGQVRRFSRRKIMFGGRLMMWLISVVMRDDA